MKKFSTVNTVAQPKHNKMHRGHKPNPFKLYKLHNSGDTFPAGFLNQLHNCLLQFDIKVSSVQDKLRNFLPEGTIINLE